MSQKLAVNESNDHADNDNANIGCSNTGVDALLTAEEEEENKSYLQNITSYTQKLAQVRRFIA